MSSRLVVCSPFAGWIHFGVYEDGATAMLIRARPEEGSAPIAKATVCLADFEPGETPPGHVWVKTWAENVGLLESLEVSGVLDATVRSFDCSPHATARLCKLSPHALEELERQRAAALAAAAILPDLEPLDDDF